MEMSRQERIELHDRLVVMLDGVRQELMSRFPEVVSVDLGLKERNGTITSEFSWRVFVQEKKPEADLKPEQKIPKEVKGIPTDVQVQKIYRLQYDDSNYDTLVGGIMVTGSGGSGTLGCFVTIGAGTAVHMLSNHHVLYGSSGSAGDLVGQPYGACDLCCCKCCEVAKLVNGVVGVSGGTNNIVDAAVAILMGQTVTDTKTTAYLNTIPGIGPIFGSGTAVMGETLRKVGISTGLTSGTVTSLTSNFSVDMGSPGFPNLVAYTNQIDVTAPNYSEGGDSGAAVVNATGQVVGLHFAGDVNGGSANLIANVSSELGGITVLSSGTAETVPNSAYATAPPLVTANPTNFLKKIELKLKETQCGQEFLSSIQENRREVLDLINDHREVKVAWNRFQGPAFIGHFAKNANEPDHRIPNEVDGYSLQNLLIKMNDVLERNGSRKLAKAVEDYSQTAFQFANEYGGIDSIDTMLTKENFCPKCGTLKNGKHYA